MLKTMAVPIAHPAGIRTTVRVGALTAVSVAVAASAPVLANAGTTAAEILNIAAIPIENKMWMQKTIADGKIDESKLKALNTKLKEIKNSKRSTVNLTNTNENPPASLLL